VTPYCYSKLAGFVGCQDAVKNCFFARQLVAIVVAINFGGLGFGSPFGATSQLDFVAQRPESSYHCSLIGPQSKA